jgi:hypothetical protein
MNHSFPNLTSPEKLFYYRLANLILSSMIGLFAGLKYDNILLVGTAVLVIVVDSLLILFETTDLLTLQLLRFGAFACLGPLWIRYGLKYESPLLLLSGLGFLFGDGSLFAIGLSN